MSENIEFTQVADNLMVTIDYTLTVDEKIINSSEKNGPIQFVQGYGEIIPGLERQLKGLALGTDQQIIVTPDEGYGEFKEDRLVDVPRDELPENMPLKLGVKLKMKDEDGKPLQAHVYEIGDEFVKLNFNHVLAGKELQFDVTVIELRAATLEELDPDQD